ncbi:MAG: NAD(P)-dependent oxidoreductase [Candidatus Nanohalobium sp.]
MDVAWFDAEEWERKYLAEVEPGFEIDFYEEPLNEDNMDKASDYDVVTVFVDSDISEKVIDCFDGRMIACRSTGYDHVATEYASSQGIAVCNVPEYGDSTVAEHTFGLILALNRKIFSAIKKVQEGNFNHEGLRGHDLKGKKLGVIGTGSIGKRVIDIANSFDMDVIASDPYPDMEAANSKGFMYVSRKDLLRQADIVTLHCPLTDETDHLLSEEEFELMDSTVLINTARGKLIDTDALIEGLENGSVRHAGLDVLEEEAYIEDDIEQLSKLEDRRDIETVLEDHVLMDRDDVLITPHNGFNSVEAMQRIEDMTVENIEKGRNIVNRPG